jgi:hypothetical protein
MRHELTLRIYRSGVGCEPHSYLAFSGMVYVKFYPMLYLKQNTAIIMLKIFGVTEQNSVRTSYLRIWCNCDAYNLDSNRPTVKFRRGGCIVQGVWICHPCD